MNDQSSEVVEGKLASITARDAAGRVERPFILTLASPVCLMANDPDDNVQNARTIHIFSSQDKIQRQIARFAGKTVVVRGQPFAAHTAHHHAPIVMDITEIGPK
jgi:hypothetical protein